MNTIYIHTNKVNGKTYVGRTKLTMKQRLLEHLNDTLHGCTFAFHRAIRKYGKDAFESRVLETNVPNDKVRYREIYWIAFYDGFTKGYNMTIGGDGKDGYTTPQEVKNKISSTKKELLPCGKTRAKVSYERRTATLLKEDPNALMKIGKKSSRTQKQNGKNKGINNPNSATIEVYDNDDNLLFESKGNFKELCSLHNLPTRVLTQSYQKGGVPIYTNTRTPKRLLKSEFRGYYAKKIFYENN